MPAQSLARGVLGTVPVDPDGTWSYEAELAPGEHEIVARALEIPAVVGARGIASHVASGELLVVETLTMPGKGNVTVTGKLGDVMKESAQAAVSYVRSRAANLMIDDDVSGPSEGNDDGQVNPGEAIELPVALRNLVTTEEGRGPALIERKDQQRLVTVTANVAERDLGSVAADIQRRLDQIPRPVGYDLIIAGDFEEQQKAFRDLFTSLLLALLLVYMVLASQYESLRDPLVVMLSVPLAAVGVILTLFLTDTTLNLQSAIGCIMLAGIVVNNAIVLMEVIESRRKQGE